MLARLFLEEETIKGEKNKDLPHYRCIDVHMNGETGVSLILHNVVCRGEDKRKRASIDKLVVHTMDLIYPLPTRIYSFTIYYSLTGIHTVMDVIILQYISVHVTLFTTYLQ